MAEAPPAAAPVRPSIRATFLAPSKVDAMAASPRFNTRDCSGSAAMNWINRARECCPSGSLEACASAWLNNSADPASENIFCMAAGRVFPAR